MSKEKTHYRKAFNSPYLSSADIVKPVVLTVKYVRLEPDKTKKTKEYFNTAYFVETSIRQGEPLKPMILNAGNSAIMKHFADSAFIEDWTNITIALYVDPNVRFGRDTVEGLRIDSNKPEARKTLTKGGVLWDNAIAAYKRDGNLDKVKARVDISLHLEEELIAEASVDVA